MHITVEVVPLEPWVSGLAALQLEAGATVAEAMNQLAIKPEAGVEIGVWSRRASPDRILEDGDRIEFYRPLRCDPKDARRARADRGRG